MDIEKLDDSNKLEKKKFIFLIICSFGALLVLFFILFLQMKDSQILFVYEDSSSTNFYSYKDLKEIQKCRLVCSTLFDAKDYNIYTMDYRSYGESPEAEDYLLFIKDEKEYFFWDTKRGKIVEDLSFIKDIHYGHSSCKSIEKEMGKDIKCEDTTDFFELFIYDEFKLYTVSKDGTILDVRSENDEIDEYDNYSDNTFGFFHTYWYGNYKITQKDTKNEIYIQEVYDSEGGNNYYYVKKDKNNKFTALEKIKDFYITKDTYYIAKDNESFIYNDGKKDFESKKFTEIFSNFEGKYIAVKDKKDFMIIRNDESVIVKISEDIFSDKHEGFDINDILDIRFKKKDDKTYFYVLFDNYSSYTFEFDDNGIVSEE